MTASERQDWERIRTKGHARFIFLGGLLRWGVPFGAVVIIGTLLYDFFTQTPYRPLLLPWPIWNELGEFLILAFGFGYGMGETQWRRRERDFSHDGDVA